MAEGGVSFVLARSTGRAFKFQNDSLFLFCLAVIVHLLVDGDEGVALWRGTIGAKCFSLVHRFFQMQSFSWCAR